MAVDTFGCFKFTDDRFAISEKCFSVRWTSDAACMTHWYGSVLDGHWVTVTGCDCSGDANDAGGDSEHHPSTTSRLSAAATDAALATGSD